MKQDELERRIEMLCNVYNAIHRGVGASANLSEDERGAKLRHYRRLIVETNAIRFAPIRQYLADHAGEPRPDNSEFCGHRRDDYRGKAGCNFCAIDLMTVEQLRETLAKHWGLYGEESTTMDRDELRWAIDWQIANDWAQNYDAVVID